MLKHTSFCIIQIYMLITIMAGQLYAWGPKDEHTAHTDISKYAVEESVLSANHGNILQNLGFVSGVSTVFQWDINNDGKIAQAEKYNVAGWLSEVGAAREDSNARELNHFYNPILNVGFGLWMGAPVWAQSSTAQAAWRSGPPQENIPEMPWDWYFPESTSMTDWSWQATRRHFYSALTSPEDLARQASFAKTFRGVGQQVHLLQDMSVPAHTRIDLHLYRDGLEAWAKTNIDSLQALKSYVSASSIVMPTMPLVEMINGFVPVAQLFDTDSYDSTVEIVMTNTKAGLAEWSNSNFFSDETINLPGYTKSEDFPFPNQINTDIQKYINQEKLPEIVTAEDGLQDTKVVISKISPAGIVEIKNFAKPGYLTEEANSNVYHLTFNLDEACYRDYASLLLPRAVGYSAALIDYFFRGKLDLIQNESGSWIIVNETDEPMTGAFELFTDDEQGNRSPLMATPLVLDLKRFGTIDPITGAPLDQSGPINVTFQSDNSPLIVVFRGKLGNEEGAVAGRIVNRGIYVLALPFDHETRAFLGKRYYRVKGTMLEPVAETSLPFGLLDDGASWDDATTSWVRIDPDGFGVPLGTGGPQYLATHWDDEHKRVRYITNLSYEKEAYHPFRVLYGDPVTNDPLVTYHIVHYVGSPASSLGMYNENTGWMKYAGSPVNGLFAVLSPPGSDPARRFFPLYKAVNFNDTFVEAPALTFYGFDGTIREDPIPRDPEAPSASIVSAHLPNGGDAVEVAVPSIFDDYVMPHPTRRFAPELASSGLDRYRMMLSAPAVLEDRWPKCSQESNNCGTAYDPAQGPRAISPVYDIPSNDDSKVRVHAGDNGQFYEELFIDGKLVETSSVAYDKNETHYQILAVHGDTAVVRRTSFASGAEVPLSYWYQGLHERVVESREDFLSTYSIYVNGSRYDLSGITAVRSRYLATRFEEDPDLNGFSPVDYLTYDAAEDITGYHPDRFFINESFDRQHVLVAFDEYAYNGGEGLVHDLRYEQVGADGARSILYLDIPQAMLQNADHEATRTGRKLLLFNADGTLKAELNDPIGLKDTIGSIGILN